MVRLQQQTFCFQTAEGCLRFFYLHKLYYCQLADNLAKISYTFCFVTAEAIFCQSLYKWYGMGMERNLCGDGWGWNGSSAGMGGNGSETGRGRI